MASLTRCAEHHISSGWVPTFDDENDSDCPFTKAQLTELAKSHGSDAWKAGDVIVVDAWHQGHRIDGKAIWTGNALVNLGTIRDVDEYGHVPKEFALGESDKFHPLYWSDAIAHNFAVPIAIDAEEKQLLKSFCDRVDKLSSNITTDDHASHATELTCVVGEWGVIGNVADDVTCVANFPGGVFMYWCSRFDHALVQYVHDVLGIEYDNIVCVSGMGLD